MPDLLLTLHSLYLRSHSSGHHPQLVTTGGPGGGRRPTAKLGALLNFDHCRPIQSQHHRWRAMIRLSILDLLHLVQELLSYPQWALHPLPPEDHSLKFKTAEDCGLMRPTAQITETQTGKQVASPLKNNSESNREICKWTSASLDIHHGRGDVHMVTKVNWTKAVDPHYHQKSAFVWFDKVETLKQLLHIKLWRQWAIQRKCINLQF